MAGILPVLWAVCPWYWGFPAGVADFFQLHTVYTGSDAHLACWMGAWGFFCGGKVAGLWSWPRTSVSCWGKKWVEQYVPFPMCLYGLRSGCFQGRFEIWWIVLKYIDGTGLLKKSFLKCIFHGQKQVLGSKCLANMSHISVAVRRVTLGWSHLWFTICKTLEHLRLSWYKNYQSFATGTRWLQLTACYWSTCLPP